MIGLSKVPPLHRGDSSTCIPNTRGASGLMATINNAVTPCSRLQVVNLQGSSKCMAEYIWIGASGADLKSRTIVLEDKPCSPDDLPIAEIDGSTYGQASEEHCEVYLQPRKVFPDPFRGGHHILVLCDVYVAPKNCKTADCWDNLQPHSSNHRAACEAVMLQAAFQQPVFTVQQDYSLNSGCETFEGATGNCYGLGSAPVPIKAMPEGLSTKASARLGRDVAELHMQACLAAGVSYSGSHNSSSHQWTYKVGPCHGMDAADHVCVSRFLLKRVVEHFGGSVCYEGTESRGWHNNKCTIAFSTASSRDPMSGLSEVQCMMERLQHSHLQHTTRHTPDTPAAVHGSGGGSWHSAHEAFAAMDDKQGSPGATDSPGAAAAMSSGSCGSVFSAFTVGVGNKHASIMVPTSTLINRCGPILDRRPPANSDPYLAIMLLVTSACGIKLPVPQLNAAQLAAALASATAAAAGSMSPAALHSCGAMSIPAVGALPAAGRGSYEDSLGHSSSYGSSMLCGTADSRDVLLSELDKLDGYQGCTTRGGRKSSRGTTGGYDHGAASDVCSDASSPPLLGGHLVAAADDLDMFYE